MRPPWSLRICVPKATEKLLGQVVESLEAELGRSAVEAAPQQAVAEEPAATAPKQAHTAESATAAAEPAPIDLLELAGGTALKKYGPVVVAVLALLLAFALGRASRRRG